MNEAGSVAVAATFVWLGMGGRHLVPGAPLKIRAPDVTLRIGLGIGRLGYVSVPGGPVRTVGTYSSS
jgi:hypothetical protein